MTYEFSFSDKEARLLAMGGSFIAVDSVNVNIQDLVKAGRTGAIVRCRTNPHNCIRVVQLDDGPIGCVAGWISEDA
jgi:hypothetical protein